jgi:hypothetical protein
LTTILVGGAAVAVAFTNKINELVTWVHKYVVNTQKINERCLFTADVTTVQSFHKIVTMSHTDLYNLDYNVFYLGMWDACLHM